MPLSHKTHPLITGTLLLTAAGLLSRVLGFFYRIFLSRTIGAEGLGIYQMIFPVYGIFFSLCAGSIQTAISRFTAADPVLLLYRRKAELLPFILCHDPKVSSQKGADRPQISYIIYETGWEFQPVILCFFRNTQ